MRRAESFDWKNLALRLGSGVVLATAAVLAVLGYDTNGWASRAPFLILVAVGGVLMSREWAGMAAPNGGVGPVLATAAPVLGVILCAYVDRYAAAWAVIVLGALVAASANSRVGRRGVDGAYGVFYIAPACLVLVWLIQTPQGAGWTLMLFATTWASDIGAYLVGNWLGGPKLWPRFSPNKTWAGLFGGIALAVLAALIVAAAFMRLSLAGAALIGFSGGLAAMAGDLWESMLKRRFGVKDAGDLIPGHGGLLDRVDGLMFAVVVFAAARLVVRLHWAH